MNMDIDQFDHHTTSPEAQLAAEQDDRRLTRQNWLWKEQQQEQPQLRPVALNITTLKQLMIKEYGEQSDIVTVFNEWEGLCLTDDVATLLSGPGHFDVLRQHLQESGRAPSTCSSHLRRVGQALKLQQVQQLLQQQVLKTLQERVEAALAELKAQNSPAAAAAAAATTLAARGASAAGHLPLQQEQQQQQLHEPGSALQTLTVQQLRQLLSDTEPRGITSNQSATLNMWSAAAGCTGSSGAAVLLESRNFANLLQRLREPNAAGKRMASGTCCAYLSAVRQVLQLPAVQQLVGEQQLEQLRQQTKAELKTYRPAAEEAKSAKKAQKAAAAAAAGGAAGVTPGPAAAAAAGGGLAHRSSAGGGSGGGLLRRAFQQAQVPPAEVPCLQHNIPGAVGALSSSAATAATAAGGGSAAAGGGGPCMAFGNKRQGQPQVPGQTLPKRHQARQQQQQQPITTENLRPLLQQKRPEENINLYVRALEFWSDAVGSVKLIDMLADPDALLTALEGTGSAAMAEKRLRYIERVLVLEEVQQLLDDAAMQQLQRLLGTEKRRFGATARALKAEANTRAAAAAAQGDGAVGAPTAGQVMLNNQQEVPVLQGTQQQDDQDMQGVECEAQEHELQAADGAGRQLARTGSEAGDGEVAAATAAAAAEAQANAAAIEKLAAEAAAARDVASRHAASQAATAEAIAAATAEAAAPQAAATGAAGAADAVAAADTAMHEARGAVNLAVLALMNQLEFGSDDVHFARYDYLSSELLLKTGGTSSSLVQLQALQQVLTWLLQLPAGKVREMAIDVLRGGEGWLQQLLQCWAAEVQQTGCGVQQAAAASRKQFVDEYSAGAAAAAEAGDRGIGGYLAGLCQLLLQLLAECCQICAVSVDNLAAQDDMQQPDTNVRTPEVALLQQLAGDFLAGTAVLLLHWPPDRQQQQRYTSAGFWRSCLWVNVQRCNAAVRGGKALDMSTVGSQVQRQLQQLQNILAQQQ